MSLSRPAFYFMLASSFLVALLSYRFLFLGFSLSFPGMLSHIDNNMLAFATHVTLAPVALLLGAVQFLSAVQKRPKFHRWVGRLYGLCVLLAGLAGFHIAISAEGGMVASVGFAALACVWIVVTGIGVSHARARRFVEHRHWMFLSFALTFSGVTLRLQLLAFAAVGVEYTAASVFLAWSCWIPNLVVAQWWLARHSRGSTQVSNEQNIA